MNRSDVIPQRMLPSNFKIDQPEVPKIVVGRLAIYMREVEVYLQEGNSVISSKQLADRVGASPAQVRKELANLVLDDLFTHLAHTTATTPALYQEP